MLRVPIVDTPNIVSVFLGSSGHREFALVVKQPLHCRWRKKQWHMQALPQHRHRHVDLTNTREHIRHQVNCVKGTGVASQRDLVIGSAIYVMKYRRWQSLPCQSSKISRLVTIL